MAEVSMAEVSVAEVSGGTAMSGSVADVSCGLAGTSSPGVTAVSDGVRLASGSPGTGTSTCKG